MASSLLLDGLTQTLNFIYLVYHCPIHVVLEALYIVYFLIGYWLLVLANLLYLTFFGGEATSSHLNSLGSIQGCCLIQHVHLVRPLAIITCLSLVSEELETLWLGTNPMVHVQPLMCANHIDMIAHTPAFFIESGTTHIYVWSAAQLGIATYHTMEQCQQDSHPPMY